MPPSETGSIAATAVPILRAAAINDVPSIHYLLEIYAEQGNLLPRTINEIYRHLRDFFVVEVHEQIAACVALEIFTEDLGEVRSLVVADKYKGRGLGRMLVERVIEEARNIGLKRLMALTYVPAFFHKLGFATVPKDTLPEKVWSVCVKCYKFNNCDETAVLRKLD